ncbi:MAG: putative Trehalose/maltose transport system permease protein MalG [Promethearchaeota archaeon]|nr:MAG: putative Trehalose/maltose transport system permease protein MalG [Candidatus Lokiarchaeota archaeon]
MQTKAISKLEVEPREEPPTDLKFITAIVTPAIVLFAIAILFPVVTGIFVSFTNSSPVAGYFGNVITLENYARLFFGGDYHTRRFWQFTYQTLFFSIVSLLIEFGLGMIFANILNKEFRGRGIARATLLIPWAIPTIASSTIFRYEIVGPASNYGLINSLLTLMGLRPIAFFGPDAQTLFRMPVLFTSAPFLTEVPITATMFTVILIDVWKTTPFITLLILAALQLPSKELYKAADIAGASSFQKFRYITWPLIKPGVGVAIIFRMMNALRVYDALVVFNDDSVYSLTYLSVYYWLNANEYGMASAVAVILFAMIVVFAVSIFGTTRKTGGIVVEEEEEEGEAKRQVGLIYTAEEQKKKSLEVGREIVEEVKTGKTKKITEFSESQIKWIHRKAQIKKVLFGLAVVFMCLWCASPFLWILSRSFRDPYIEQTAFELFPKFPSLEAFRIVLAPETQEFTGATFSRALLNSVVLSSFTVVVVSIAGSFMAYALAKFDFSAKTTLSSFIFSMVALPPIIIIIPFFIQMQAVGSFSPVQLTDNLFTLVLPYAAFNLPLAIFNLQAFFEEIPDELWKAAKVDGATNFQIFRKVIFPLTIAGIFTTAILVFIYSWNELLFAQIFLPSDTNHTVPRAMLRFVQSPLSLQAPWDFNIVLMAATSVATIPLVIVVLAFQKKIISGLTQGAVKG